MHIVIAAIGIIAGIYFFIMRAKNAAEMTSELLDVADDVRAAARRFGFRRNKAAHPVDAIEDANTAAATVAMAYLELHGLPTEETRNALIKSLQSELQIPKSEAEELLVLGRWLMNECNGPEPAIPRASRQLYKLTSGDIGPLMEILKTITSDPIGDRQRDALEDIRRAFRIR